MRNFNRTLIDRQRACQLAGAAKGGRQELDHERFLVLLEMTKRRLSSRTTHCVKTLSDALRQRCYVDVKLLTHKCSYVFSFSY